MLSRLSSLERPIRVAIVGVGSAGKGLFYQCGITPQIDCVAIADLDVDKAVSAAQEFRRPHRVVDDATALERAITEGLVAICQDGELLARCESVDVFIEASSAIAEGGRFALAAIESAKDLVMVNSEADLIFGPHLMRLAQTRGLVYTSCDGDQQTCVARMIEDIRLWGFELVMAGNVKGYLDRYSDPTSIVPEAEKRFLDPKMCTSYTDGTKLCVEMALVANAFDLVTLVPGMRGPSAAKITDVLDLFALDQIWESGQPVVDYVLGSQPPGGVFVVGHCGDRFQQSMLSWFPPDLGRGPFYVFERPYHLVHIEAMRCIAEAFLDRDALLQPLAGFKTNVYAYAKRDLKKGDRLDGIGGYACYGLIENCSDNDPGSPKGSGLPICLADDVVLGRDISRDQKILMSDVVTDSSRLDYELYLLAMAT